jgi:4-hydroxyphenylacetate 3-monooxygenase/4-hydroxybutyryl-CoA dehydratase/vinylacetyl-CoA-Delta-isomerase
METICMMQRYPLEELKGIAKYLAGIPGYEKCPRFERGHVDPSAMLAKFDAAKAAKAAK